MKREQQQLLGSCLTRFRSHTTKSSYGCCRCCFCPWKKKIDNTHSATNHMHCLLPSSKAALEKSVSENTEGKTTAKRILQMQFPLVFTCNHIMSSQFSSRSRGLGTSPNWNAWFIKVEVEDRTGQAKSLIAQQIKLLNCCIGLFKICVLQLCNVLSLFLFFRFPWSYNIGRVWADGDKLLTEKTRPIPAGLDQLCVLFCRYPITTVQRFEA